MLMLSYTAEKKLDRLTGRFCCAIDDESFVVDHGEPSICCCQRYSQSREKKQRQTLVDPFLMDGG
jgi:hypothetical protein